MLMYRCGIYYIIFFGMIICLSFCYIYTNVAVAFHQVRKEERDIKRSVIKSVVGTLDLSIRFFLQGETFPGVIFSFRFEI